MPEAVIFFLMRSCLVNGVGWPEFVETALNRMKCTDDRIKAEMLVSDSYISRLWFMIIILYVLDVRVTETDAYTSYMIKHAYKYIRHVLFVRGDVFVAMYVLHSRMEEYDNMLRPNRVE